MKKFLISTSLVSAFVFSGCSSNHALVNFKKDQFNANALQFTKKSDITIEDNPKVLFFATYLNSIDKKYNDNAENFLVAVYFVNEDNQDFAQRGYRLVLNEENETVGNIEEVKATDPFVQNLPLKNPWAKYYRIKFDKLEDYDLDLKLTKCEKTEPIEDIEENKELIEEKKRKEKLCSTSISFQK